MYILYSARIDKYYIGSTSDLSGRIRRHHSDHKGYTGKSDDWKLVHFEEFSTRPEAIKREKRIKKWKSKLMIERIIHNGSGHTD